MVGRHVSYVHCIERKNVFQEWYIWYYMYMHTMSKHRLLAHGCPESHGKTTLLLQTAPCLFMDSNYGKGFLCAKFLIHFTCVRSLQTGGLYGRHKKCMRGERNVNVLGKIYSKLYYIVPTPSLTSCSVSITWRLWYTHNRSWMCTRNLPWSSLVRQYTCRMSTCLMHGMSSPWWREWRTQSVCRFFATTISCG